MSAYASAFRWLLVCIVRVRVRECVYGCVRLRVWACVRVCVLFAHFLVRL